MNESSSISAEEVTRVFLFSLELEEMHFGKCSDWLNYVHVACWSLLMINTEPKFYIIFQVCGVSQESASLASKLTADFICYKLATELVTLILVCLF